MNNLTILLQASSVGAPEFIMILLAFGFFVLIFFVLRSVVLWYWKVNLIVANQLEQTELLKIQNNLIKEHIQLLKFVTKPPAQASTPEQINL
ncbi:hypothetical protein A0256_04505 [Mucilaginibacter sp. PAMC 26640]|nr:hypothetical protein A0256_04505 [Mucilaginibacter sp. PAMC 26640]